MSGNVPKLISGHFRTFPDTQKLPQNTKKIIDRFGSANFVKPIEEDALTALGRIPTAEKKFLLILPR